MRPISSTEARGRGRHDFETSHILDGNGVLRAARIVARGGQIVERHVGDPVGEDAWPADFAAEGLPVDIHRHTVGGWDFADLASIDIHAVNERARAEGIFCVPCAFVSREELGHFVDFMRDFAESREQLPHIPAIGLEGPLLASSGGTPPDGSWRPLREEWEQLAACGAYGLRYCVISPDALMPQSCVDPELRLSSPPLDWIVRTLADGGVAPALGHFARADPSGSAASVRDAVRAARAAGTGVLSDHFLNDMPSDIAYAWRTSASHARRQQDLERLTPERWTVDDVGDVMGDVPAAMLQAVREDDMMLFVNFDGDHVDRRISTRLAELYSPNVVAMTDRVDVPRFGGEPLLRGEAGHLWYRPGGIVAAGSSTIDDQIATLREAHLPLHAIWSAVSSSPLRALGLEHGDDMLRPEAGLTVFVDGARRYAGYEEAIWAL